MLIGEEKINDIFNSWFEKYGFETRIEGLDNDFGWNCRTNRVSYSFVRAEQFDTDFMSVCNDLGLKYDIDVFWMSLLHEIGHSKTYMTLTDEEIDEAFELSGFDYYYCQREIIATKWAVDFVNNSLDMLLELIEWVKPAIIQFFMDNDIETDE